MSSDLNLNTNSSDSSELLMQKWLLRIRESTDMLISRISFEECKSWKIRDGEIKHDNDAFFSLTYLQNEREQKFPSVYINQPEIGILAFVLTSVNGAPGIVIQAKDEPGNELITQIAPTVQATYSNYSRKHGGKPTKYLDLVLACDSRNVVSSSLQSENGSKFFQKRNRNQVCISRDINLDPEGLYSIWRLEKLFSLIDCDFTINTDARSVLASSDWAVLLLGSRKCFTLDTSDFTLALFNSYYRDKEIAKFRFARALKLLITFRKRAITSWIKEDIDLEVTKTFEFQNQIRFINVKSSRREVSEWNQPIHHDLALRKHLLICTIVNESVLFLVRVCEEIGLKSRCEFSCSFSYKSDWSENVLDPLYFDLHAGGHRKVISVCQTDEGGRFFKAYADYEIREIPNAVLNSRLESRLIEEGFMWVDAMTLNLILETQEMSTNELRSVSSLLLKWL